MDKPNSRIQAVDFTKGVLVVLMVVYHVLNYLDYGSIPHDYMAFLPSSFIMITGFLVTQVYSVNQPGFEAVASRLAGRAVKLVALFTCLNVGGRVLWSRDHYGTALDVSTFFSAWTNVYITGDAPGIAFEVLLPISYTLLLSIVFLRIRPRSPYLTGAVAIAVFLLCTLMDLNGRSINTLNLISAGLIGMALGSFGLQTVDRHARSGRFQIVLVVTYIAVLLLGLDNYVAQILVTFASLAILYLVGGLLYSEHWLFGQVTLLGRYSLVSYIAQILYLQATDHLVTAESAFPLGNALLLMAVIALSTWVTVLGVDYGRHRIGAVDRVYKALFA